MKKNWLENWGLFIIVSTALLLSACGVKEEVVIEDARVAKSDRPELKNNSLEEENSEEETEEEETDYIEDYTENLICECCSICLTDDMDEHALRTFDTAGDRIFISLVNADPEEDDRYTSYTNRQFDRDGNMIAEYTEKMKNEFSPAFAKIDDEGIIYSVMDDSANYDDFFTGNLNGIFLNACTPEGREIWSINLKKYDNDLNYYVKDMEMMQGGRIALLTTRGIEIFSRDGVYDGCIHLDASGGCRLVSIQNGNLLLLSCTGFDENGCSGFKVNEVDVRKAVLKPDAVEFPVPVTYTNCNSDSLYDVILSDDRFLYGYDIETEQFDVLVDYLYSGLFSVEASRMKYFPDGRMFILDEPDEHSNKLYGKVYEYDLGLW